MFERLRLLTGGESHGPEMTAIIEGLPAGFVIDRAAIDAQLQRRQRGFGSGGRMAIESDRVELTAGAPKGRTTGAPLVLKVRNRDWDNWRRRRVDPVTRPRPGHVDLAAATKYGYDDLRAGLERASARETCVRVAAGAIARGLLAELGVELGGYVRAIGGHRLELPEADAGELAARAARALENDVACPTPAACAALEQEIAAARRDRDTLGGIIEVFAAGLVPGLGSHVDPTRRLDGRIAMAMLALPAMKGVEFGPAFDNAGRRGTAVHDEIAREGRTLRRRTNRAGGLEGGLTTGEPLLVRLAMKPISTTLTPLGSVDLATGDEEPCRYERSDFCATPRAVPIAEAALALVLLDAVLARTGADTLDQLRERWAGLPRGTLDDFRLTSEPWRFVYGDEPDSGAASGPEGDRS